MTSTVYVIQLAAKFDRTTNKWVEKFDMSRLEDFGHVEIVLQPYHKPIYEEQALSVLRTALSGYKPGDYIVASGSGIWCAAAGAVLRGKVETIRFLQWDKKIDQYRIVTLSP